MRRNIGNGKVRSRPPAFEQGAWILYQFKLRGITQRALAKQIGVCDVMIRRVAFGRGTSARVQKAIAKALGLGSWSEIAAARQGRAA